jgi:trimeric autotransporter adhesin
MKRLYTIACIALMLFSFNGYSQVIYALNGNNLVSFNATTPGIITATVAITGITAGQTIEGMDFRPTTGELFIIGYNSSTGDAQLYKVNRTTGAATMVGASPVTIATGIQQMGFDFNPTVDRIRVTGNNDFNYRLNPGTGLIAAIDQNLAYAAADPNSSANPSVGALAYTNSYIGATTTTLYNFDYALNILTNQNPPNNGTLNTVGPAGVSVNASEPSIDMDIYLNPTTGLNVAYFAANTGAATSDNFYTLNLATGAATLIGTIGGGMAIKDIAVFIDRTMPALTGKLTYGLTSSSTLITFDSANPNFIRTVTSISGLATGDVLLAIDSRPATAELFALAYNTTSTMSQLYTINATTAVATAVGSPLALNLTNENIGFDFNPIVDRIRVTVSGSNADYRLNPATGAIAATDLNLVYANGDPNQGQNPTIGASAYTNNFAGATSTTLYDYDDSLNILTTQNPPNNGTLNTIGPSGITLNPADRTSGLDIYYDFLAATNKGYLNANPGSATSDNLYSVNLATGSVTLVGSIGLGIAVKDITFSIDSIPLAVEEIAGSINPLHIFPNPARSEISIELPVAFASESIYAEITDIAGRIVLTQNVGLLQNNILNLDVAALKKGMYTIQLHSAEGRINAKFIKE